MLSTGSRRPIFSIAKIGGKNLTPRAVRRPCALFLGPSATRPADTRNPGRNPLKAPAPRCRMREVVLLCLGRGHSRVQRNRGQSLGLLQCWRATLMLTHLVAQTPSRKERAGSSADSSSAVASSLARAPPPSRISPDKTS